MRLYNMLGYKLFKEDEDNIHMIRIVGMKRPINITAKTPDPAEVVIYDYDTNQKRTERVENLKEYSPLKPDGILSFSVVGIKSGKSINKDVIVTATKFINLEFGATRVPYAVCRQSITDIFYNLIATNSNNTLVGLSVNEETCPSNFDYRIMFAADEVYHNDFVNFYRTDILEDILTMIKTTRYDDTLKDLYEQHVQSIRKPELLFKNEHSGWCKNLKTLLKQNNFQSDINQMLGITDVKFDVSEYIHEANNGEIDYLAANDDLRLWLSTIYKINIREISVMEFDHDINLGDFNDVRYLLIRDINNTLYLMVYTIEGEYHEADLEAKAKELDFSTKFKIEFYNKYNSDNK